MQVISDFGWGQKKQGTEEWLATFEDTYFLKQYRIGGDAIRCVLSACQQFREPQASRLLWHHQCQQLC